MAEGPKATHTPKPWKHDDSDALFPMTCVRHHRQVICLLPTTSSIGIPTDEDLANARLIEAAPDLLEATQMLLDEVPPAGDWSDFLSRHKLQPLLY